MIRIPNLVLIGMPGSGKSTVGVLAAKALGMRFLDSDILLQERIGMLLHEYIAAHGIRAFLDKEGECLAEIRADHCVVATGGSAVLRRDAMEALGRNARSVAYLKLSAEALEKRLTNITTRGIAMVPGQSIRELYEYRAPLYERYSTVTVDCEGQSVEETVTALIKAVTD